MIRKYILIAALFQCLIYGFQNKGVFNEFKSKLSKYSIVTPQVIHRSTRSINRPLQSKEKYEDETLSYTLQINNRKHTLHLKQNRDFLHPNFVQHSRYGSGKYKSSYPKQRNCYYHGEVEGYEDSVVALSTCSGLRGVILLGNETFALEPVPQSETNEHLLYLLADIESEPATCGVISEAASEPNHEPFEPGQTLITLLRRKRNLPQTSHIELALVVDNQRYNFKKRNETAVRDEMVEMANLLDGYYKQLNIRVVLVGLEIFKDDNPFDVDGSAGQVLGRFAKWRKNTLVPKIRHDTGQLIVGRPGPYGNNILGMAYVGTVCSITNAAGINVFSGDNLASASTVVAHEMGHNLGMKHDSGPNCQCDGKSCIMGATGGTAAFSQCSANNFESLIRGGGGACLRNQPSPSLVIGTAECGNGRLDEGEDCDCGKPEECKSKCCNAATCKFTRGSSCDDGECCENCQIKVSGSPCRKSVNTCDLPEYCNGRSEFCPNDFYLMDGLSCQNNAAYCYEGRCQTYSYQCKHLFQQDSAIKAADICFQHANTIGDKFGNCGLNARGDYIACSVANAMCGKVQCTGVDVNHPPEGATASIQIVDGSRCVNADFNLGTDVLDPAYVNPGSPCAKGKACLNFACVNASALLPLLNCDAKTTCNGRGVCNDQGHCHCNNGWAPPNCDRSGWGGSIDSGPAEIDYSLRNGLLVFFFLVVPIVVVLVLVMLYFFKPESLDPCLKGRLRSHKPGNGNRNLGLNGNVQTSAAAQPSVQAPTDWTGSQPATSPPTDGYEDEDYWNKEKYNIPPHPPAPVQGPGVPRPISAK
ncbi:disintegrin and metalloproteinase domain-containing protein 9 isoform 2-T2 [Pholidichthys leucotaenia]